MSDTENSINMEYQKKKLSWNFMYYFAICDAASVNMLHVINFYIVAISTVGITVFMVAQQIAHQETCLFVHKWYWWIQVCLKINLRLT